MSSETGSLPLAVNRLEPFYYERSKYFQIKSLSDTFTEECLVYSYTLECHVRHVD